jgi:hypothetical protein
LLPAPVQAAFKQHEMHRFIGADRQPIIDKGARHVRAKASGHVKGQVNGRKLNMCKGVQHRDAPSKGAGTAARGHFGRRQQVWPGGARRAVGHRHIKDMGDASQPPVARNLAGAHHFGAGCGRFQNRPNGAGKAGHRVMTTG